MITEIVLILIVLIGVLIIVKDNYGFIGFMLAFVFGVLLIVNTIEIATVRYSFNVWKYKRDAFEETIKEARKSGNMYENAAITKEIAEFNKQLNTNQQLNKDWFWGQYIDDRVDELKPIK